MSDASERNERVKAAMRDQKTDNLNTSGQRGVKVCSPSQSPGVKRPTGHVDVGTGKRS